MSRKAWTDYSPRARRVIIAGATLDGVLKGAALIDLARRPPSQVRGSKVRWALAIAFINSAGVLPIVYFTRGRRLSGRAR